MANTTEKEVILSWAVEYAKSGRSKCQITKQNIPQGALRIGREVDNPFRTGSTMFLWSEADALFKSFRLGAADKERIRAVDDLVGFDELKSADKKKLAKLVDELNTLQTNLAQVDANATRLEHTKNGGVFWSVAQSGNTTRVRWGAIGEVGNVSEKIHKDDATAENFVAKKIAEKEKGGYVLAGSATSGDTADTASSPNQPQKRKASGEAEDESDAAAVGVKDQKKIKTEPQLSGGSGDADDEELIHSWAVEYAKSGRSKCQITKQNIPQGALRIGKEVDNPFRTGSTMFLWSDADALFKSFRLGAADKERIRAVDDLAGFDELKAPDKKKLTNMIDEMNTLQTNLAQVDSDATRLEHTKNGGVFWSVVQSGNTTRVRWGAIGEAGNVSEKVHKDDATAANFMTKKIAEKEKGGYVRVGANMKKEDNDEENNETKSAAKKSSKGKGQKKS